MLEVTWEAEEDVCHLDLGEARRGVAWRGVGGVRGITCYVDVCDGECVLCG